MISKFEIGEAIKRPTQAPGGRAFLISLIMWTTVCLLGLYALLGESLVRGYANLLQVSYELQTTNDPDMAMGSLSRLSEWVPVLLLLGLGSWLVLVSAETAFHRHMFFADRRGGFPLRFGRTELQVMFVQFVIGLTVVAIYIGALLLAIIPASVITSSGSGAGVAIAALLMVFAVFFAIGAMVAAIVRLSPAAALTVRSGTIHIYAGWKLTKGRVWPLIGSFAIVAIVGYLVTYSVILIFSSFAFGNSEVMSVLSGAPTSDPSTLFAQAGEMLQKPHVMATLVIGLISYVATYNIWYMFLWGISNYFVSLMDNDKTVFD